MQSKQPGAQYDQNCGDDHGLQEKPPCTLPTHHHEQHCGCSGDFQVHGIHHLSGPELGNSHRQQRLYFPRQLRKFSLPQKLLKQFYSAVIESVLCISITVWFGSATKSGMRRLQRMVRCVKRIIGGPLQELYTSRVRKRAQKITLDPSHPSHPLFELLPSGRRHSPHYEQLNVHNVPPQ